MLILLSTILLSMNAVANTSDAYAKVGPLIFQVKTATSENAEKSTYGSSFVVDKNGLLVTNYHVVDSHFWNDEFSKIFVKIKDKNYQASVERIDIVNDLALIKVDYKFDSALKIAQELPRKGESLFTLGLPQDLEWTVVAGVYNGLTKTGPRELFYMNTPLSGGMSGGPTVNAKFELVAVNASVKREGNLISFGVPFSHVNRLIQKGRETESDRYKVISKQLGDFQQSFTEEILRALSKKRKLLDSYVPDFAGSLKCWGSSDNTTKLSYEKQTESCSNSLGTLTIDEIVEGYFSSHFGFVSNKSLNNFAWQELKTESFREHTKKGMLTANYNARNEINFKYPKCKAQTVKNGASYLVFDLCIQKIDRLENLFDAKIAFYKNLGSSRYLYGNFTFYGFTRENLLKISEAFLKFNYETEK